jgi:hypothetical protein
MLDAPAKREQTDHAADGEADLHWYFAYGIGVENIAKILS